MSGIIEASDLPEYTKVYLKKGAFGYRIVHPIKINGKVNWVNLLVGGWGNFLILILIIAILLSFFFGVKEMMASCKDMAENPCRYFGNLNCPKGSPIVTPMGDYGLKMIPNYSNIPHEK